MLNESITKINSLNKQKAKLEEEIKEREDAEKEIEAELSTLRKTALLELKETGLKEYHDAGLVAFLCETSSKGYSKEEEKLILEILKKNKLANCISIKESLAKRELKEELKTNTVLKDLLKNYGKETSTEYIQVMTEEDAVKRQQAIDEAKNKK